MEEQTINLGDFRIEYAEGKLKIMSTNNRKNIAVVPSSGNSVIIIPVESGLSQFRKD
jgi:hypothetical protein